MFKKSIKLYSVNLSLFDGDAQGSDDSAANTSQQTQDTGEEMVEIEGVQIPKRLSGLTVDEEKPAEETKTETAKEADAGDNATPAKDVIDFESMTLAQINALDPAKLQELFDSKIKPVFKDQITKTVNGQFDRRFKAAKEKEAKFMQDAKIVDDIMVVYGFDPKTDKREALVDLYLEDLADKLGFDDVESYLESIKDNDKSKQNSNKNTKADESEDDDDPQDDDVDEQAEIQKILDGMYAEANELKKVIPDYDLDKECEDSTTGEKFKGYLSKGLTQKEAYELTHGTAKQVVVKQESKIDKVKAANAARPGENGLDPTVGATPKTNIAKVAAGLTTREFNEMAEMLANGTIKDASEYKPKR